MDCSGGAGRSITRQRRPSAGARTMMSAKAIGSSSTSAAAAGSMPAWSNPQTQDASQPVEAGAGTFRCVMTHSNAPPSPHTRFAL